MSTGDQSGYMRAKMAERGTSQGVQFSRDGFDNWAESETPARVGQVEKMPAETQMASTGGAMTLAKAKHYAKSLGIQPFHVGGMHGGRSFLGIQIPEIVEKAIEWGEKILNFALLVDKKLPEIEQAIQEEIIDNEDDPSITAKDREIAKAFLPLIKTLKPYLATLRNIKAAADQIKSALGGSGRHGMHGGATAAENFKKVVDVLQRAYTKLKSYIDFITKYGKFLLQMLKLRPLQPIGNEILEKIKPILSLVGLGRGKSHSSKHCECSDSDSEEYHGGRVGGRRHGGFGFDFSQIPGVGPQYGVGNSSDSAEQYDEVFDPLGISKRMPRKSQGIQGGPLIGAPPVVGGRKVGGRKHGGFLPPMKQVSYNTGMSQEDRLEYARRVAEDKKQRAAVGGRRKPSVAVSDQHVAMFGGKTSYVPTLTVGGRRKVGGASCGGKKPSARGEIVKKVMREQGLSLPQASKYVKEHGLY
jgi:hypothetical protein